MMQKERELKEAVRIDRDKEIEAAILRLEDDMHHQRGELDKTAENRLPTNYRIIYVRCSIDLDH